MLEREKFSLKKSEGPRVGLNMVFLSSRERVCEFLGVRASTGVDI